MTKTDTRDVAGHAAGDLGAGGGGLRHRPLRGAGAGGRREAGRDQAADPDPARRRHPLQLQAGPDRARAGRGRPAAESRQHRRQEVRAWRSSTSPRTGRSRSASASTPARSRRTCSRSTAARRPQGMVESALRHIHILEELQLPGDEDLAQGLRPADDDRGLPDAGRPGRLRVPPRRHRGRHARASAPSSRRSGSARCSARASATRSACRSRPIPPRKSGSASTS